jgi:hypothetical protein
MNKKAFDKCVTLLNKSTSSLEINRLQIRCEKYLIYWNRWEGWK